MIYETYKAEMSGDEFIKRNNEDGSISFIPKDESNSDYQAYLNTLASESQAPAAPTA